MNPLKFIFALIIGSSLMISACEAPRQETVAPEVRPDTPVEASDLIGKQIENREGETLGRIDDLAIDPETGRLAFVLVSSGAVLGIGGNDRVLPPGALEVEYRNGDAYHRETRVDDPAEAWDERALWRTPDDVTLVVDISSDQWEDTPTVDRDELAQREPAEHQDTYARFQQQWHRDLDATRMVWATDLRGMDVMLHEDESIGSIDEILIDLDGGRAPFVLIAANGLLDDRLGTQRETREQVQPEATPGAQETQPGVTPEAATPGTQPETTPGTQPRTAPGTPGVAGTQRERYMIPLALLQIDEEENVVRLQADLAVFQQARTITPDEWDRVRVQPGDQVYIYTGLDRMYGHHDEQVERDEETQIMYN